MIKMDNEEIICFEVNNWFSGRHYPDREPWLTWMWDEILIFSRPHFARIHHLCVVAGIIDMSVNYCVTAPRSFIEKHCPTLLAEDSRFLREPSNDGEVYGKFGHKFLPYKEENIGVFWAPDYNDITSKDDLDRLVKETTP